MQNFPDGVNTISFSFRDRDKWVTDILLEFVSTKSQSGPSHNDPDDPETVLGGNDNYFNNGAYRSGWTYYGRTIGLPLFTPSPVNGDGLVLGVCNNRVVAHHLAIAGKVARKIPYRFKATYSRNYGKYTNSLSIFSSVPEQLSLALEVTLPRLGRSLPVSLSAGLYGDVGELYPDNFGLTLSLSWAGRWRHEKLD